MKRCGIWALLLGAAIAPAGNARQLDPNDPQDALTISRKIACSTETAGSHVGWARMSDWLPWMKMSGREGLIYMHTAGLRLSSWDALPSSMKEEIANHYPDYRTPPSLDDDRPNVTSWIYYQRVREGAEAAPDRSGG